ncbi:MAG: GNAT family N-acetyltransferase [Chloroflexota bacterium]|nr:GNAT family N-acetyltransferase [Chloroflexota bacterium]
MSTRTVSNEIRIPEAPPIEGLRFRHYRGRPDHPAMAELNTATRVANGMVEVTTTAAIDVDYAHLINCDLGRDFIAADLDGRLVGYGRVYWVDRNDGTRTFETVCHVHPAFRRRGIGAALFAWQRRRSVELLSELPADRPAIAAAYIFGQDLGGRVLVEDAGYRLVRRSSELVRPDFDAIPDLPLPPGFEVRPIDPTDRAALRQVWDAGAEAFGEHWGESPEESSEDQFTRFLESPEFEPRLWQVAFHGEEVAGHILNYLDPPEPDGSRTGWTESIGVRKRYRRRGLARALLARSLRTVRDAGATRAALGVDTENVNHALDLYESLGFRVVAEQLEFHRPLESRKVDR